MCVNLKERLEDGAGQGRLPHRITNALVFIGKAHRDLTEKRLNKTGVYRVQHQLLMCISANPDVSQKELAMIQNVSSAAIAVSLKKLEKGGYIERAVDKHDNRYNKIRITEKGEQVVKQSVQIFCGIEEVLVEGFTEEEQKQFLGYLCRARENLKNQPGGEPVPCRNSSTEREGKTDEAL